jgi:PEP-CTERM motif
MKVLLSAVLLVAGAALAKADTLETITFNLGSLHPGSTLSATFDVPTVIGTGVTLPVIFAFSDPSDYAEGSLTGPTGGTLAGTVSIESNIPISNFVVDFFVPTFFNPTGNSFTKEDVLSEDGLARCASFPCTATGQFQDSMAFSNGVYTVAPAAAATPEPSSFMLLATGLAGAALLYTSRKRFAGYLS